MSWMKKNLPRFLHRQQKSSEQQEENEVRVKPVFTVGDWVCFHRNIGDDSVCGIGIIEKLKSTPVMENGKIAFFTYVADIQPIYEVSHTWELRSIDGAEYCSDDPIITFSLPNTMILFGKLEMLEKLKKNTSEHAVRMREELKKNAGRYEILPAVPEEYFCRADHHEALRLCYGRELPASSMRVW